MIVWSGLGPAFLLVYDGGWTEYSNVELSRAFSGFQDRIINNSQTG